MNVEHTMQLIEELRMTKDIVEFVSKYNFDAISISFTEYLDQKIEESHLKKSEIIRTIDMSRSYAYEVFNGFKNPSRDKVIMLAFGMKMDYEETQKLLIKAKHNPLHPKDRRDSIIMYCLYNNHSFVETNMLLDGFLEPLLS